MRSYPLGRVGPGREQCLKPRIQRELMRGVGTKKGERRRATARRTGFTQCLATYRVYAEDFGPVGVAQYIHDGTTTHIQHQGEIRPVCGMGHHAVDDAE